MANTTKGTAAKELKNLTKIELTYADDEVYVLAVAIKEDEDKGMNRPSIQLAHIQGGFSKDSSLIINPKAVLPHGRDMLIFIGISWRGDHCGDLRGKLTFENGAQAIGVQGTANQIGVYTKLEDRFEVTIGG